MFVFPTRYKRLNKMNDLISIQFLSIFHVQKYHVSILILRVVSAYCKPKKILRHSCSEKSASAKMMSWLIIMMKTIELKQTAIVSSGHFICEIFVFIFYTFLEKQIQLFNNVKDFAPLKMHIVSRFQLIYI